MSVARRVTSAETLLCSVPSAREYVVERSGNPVRLGGQSSLEWAGDVLAVDDEVAQRVERSASDRMGGGAGVCSQLFDEFGWAELRALERVARSASIRSKLPRYRSMPLTKSRADVRVLSVRWATTSRTLHRSQSDGASQSDGSSCSSHRQSSRRSASTSASTDWPSGFGIGRGSVRRARHRIQT